MLIKAKPHIGIIGAGRLGTTVAAQALKAGYEVHVANAQGPKSLRLILQILLKDAVAETVTGAIEQGDIVILAIPLNQYTTLNPDLFAGKVVIDAMNYWAPVEGNIPEFTDPNTGSSEVIQRYLPRARVVKALSHVAYNELAEHSLPAGSPNRRAIALAGDDSEAKAEVSQLIDDIGFDPVDLGPLTMGRKFQPDTTLFNARYTAEQMRVVASGS